MVRQAQQVQHQVARREVDLVVLTVAEHLKSQTRFRWIQHATEANLSMVFWNFLGHRTSLCLL